MVVLSGAVIIAAMGRARGPETTTADVLLPAHTQLSAAPTAAELDAAPLFNGTTPVLPEPPPRTAISNTPAAAAAAPAPAAEPTAAPAPEAREEAAVDSAVLVTPAATVDAPATTIAGCLTLDDGEYRLKDATGIAAPKSRNWKSGFLTRRAATIEIVDPNASLGLPTHVGQRVEVVGTLVEREMHARSVQQLSGSCKK